MKRFKGFGVIIVIMLLGASLVNAAANQNGVKTVLKIGKQMSNFPNMMETYSLIATNVNYKAPEERLKQRIEEFESFIAYMDKNFEDSVIKEGIAKSKKSWKNIKKALLTALEDSDPERMKKEGMFLHDNMFLVVKELSKMKKYIFKKYKLKNAKELNAALVIALSSQKISAHYIMKMWELPDPKLQEHWDKAVLSYKKSITLLKASKYYNGAKFKKCLDDTEKYLKYFTMVYSFKGKYVPSMVHQKSANAYENAHKMSAKILSE
ncbi:MAG: hypothetical protein U9N49_12680 [Campylobacterota bacterium]|nr:hypothetical protein [Campylobacterota bacterium]